MEPPAAKMTSTMTSLSDQFFSDWAATGLVKQLEHEVQAALDAYAPGWTLEDVRWRCSLVSAGPGTVQTLKFDEKPLLEIYPIENEVVPDTARVIVRYTQKVRRLYAGNS